MPRADRVRERLPRSFELRNTLGIDPATGKRRS
jgi:hypothetical protein